jgi:para-aminobenzoate synthetase/4-amino-4-deoxychorismate lyase
VEATLRAGVELPGIMSALFPPGSVTGAPKISTMKLIAELESAPRGVYCGAIGIVERGRSVFNVPIRTLWLDKRTGTAEYGTGGGITADSRAEAEYDELLTKARVISRPWPRFELLETMRLEQGEVKRLDQHLLRMEESADYFGFPFCASDVREAVHAAVRTAAPEPALVRLLLSEAGQPLARLHRLDPWPARPRVRLAHGPVDSMTPFLFHKTTARNIYDLMRAGAGDAFDALLYNERGEITEFTRGNIVVELNGERYTPARECGLLAGVFRGELLRRGEVAERVITRDEIAHAARIWFVNSVREWVEVELV